MGKRIVIEEEHIVLETHIPVKNIVDYYIKLIDMVKETIQLGFTPHGTYAQMGVLAQLLAIVELDPENASPDNITNPDWVIETVSKYYNIGE